MAAVRGRVSIRYDVFEIRLEGVNGFASKKLRPATERGIALLTNQRTSALIVRTDSRWQRWAPMIFFVRLLPRGVANGSNADALIY